MGEVKKLNDLVKNLEEEKFLLLNENKKIKEENKLLIFKNHKFEETIKELKDKSNKFDSLNELKKNNELKIQKYVNHFKTCETIIYSFINHIDDLKISFVNIFKNLTLQKDYEIKDHLKNIDFISMLKELTNLFNSSLVKKHKLFIKLKNKILSMKSINFEEVQGKFDIILKIIQSEVKKKNSYNLEIDIIKDSFMDDSTNNINKNENDDINKAMEKLINKKYNDNLLNQFENSNEPNNSLSMSSNIFNIILSRLNFFDPHLFSFKNLKTNLLNLQSLAEKFKFITYENIKKNENETMENIEYIEEFKKKKNFTFNNFQDKSFDTELIKIINDIETIIKEILETVTKDLTKEEIYNKFLQMNLKLKEFDKVVNNQDIIEKQNEMISKKLSYINFDILKIKNIIKVYKNNIEQKKLIIKNKEEELMKLQIEENKNNKEIENYLFEIMDISDKIYIKEDLNKNNEKEKLINTFKEKKLYFENISNENEILNKEIVEMKDEIEKIKNSLENNENNINETKMELFNKEEEFFEKLKNEIENDFNKDILSIKIKLNNN